MKELLTYPFNASEILKKKKRIKKELLEEHASQELKIAILGGSTTSELKDILELFLLERGARPLFYESEYNKWYEDAMFDNLTLDEFAPQIVFICTSFVNLIDLPSVSDEKETTAKLVEAVYEKYHAVWEKIKQKYSCTIIQNNFESPFYRMFGNLDFAHTNGYVSFVNRLNEKITAYAQENENFYINDINYLAAKIGLDKWYDRNFYHLYKFAFSYDSVPYVAHNLAAIIGASLGKSKKCLVLDLDNTLWGGIIGDDGVEGIKLGHETAVGEGYLDFQNYILQLKNRGVILAVCSKNEEDIAKSGFSHPDSLLKTEDFAAFFANWEPKHLNIVKIAKEINIGIDSLVFIDDNPVERQIVRDNVPEVTVPEVVGEDTASYIRAIEDGKYFETVKISADDLTRNKTYAQNRQRAELEKSFTSYEEFLASLNMTAEIKPFVPTYLDRITQLTNKTNQFNLTTKRYTQAEIENIAADDGYIKLYGRLVDKFGDNGLIAVTIGKCDGETLDIELWLMSCRVLKRDMEFAMLTELVKLAKEKGIKRIVGHYYKTKKNAMVKDLYREFGFEATKQNEEESEWVLEIEKYAAKKVYIAVNEE